MKIIDLPDDQKITENGFYRIPIDRHHNQPCDAPSVTSSVLRNIEDGATPEEIWAYHKLNPDAFPRRDTDAMRNGRAMAYLLEGGRRELERQFLILPKDHPERPLPSQIAAFNRGEPSENGIKRITYWAKVDKDPRSIITQDEFETLVMMAKRLGDDPASVMLQGEPEITMAWYDEATKLWVLSRPDQLSFSGMVSDYKKMNPGAARWFTRRLVDQRISRYGIHQQMALAWEAMHVLTGNYPSEVGIIAQSDIPPYPVIAREIDEESLSIGRFQNHRAMRLFSEAYYSGDWWGPGRDTGVYQMHPKMRERLINEMQTEAKAP